MNSQLRLSHDLCQQIALQAGSSFYYTFCLLPKPQYRAMCALYAFMRRTDDLSDDPPTPSGSAEQTLRDQQLALEKWHSEFDLAIRQQKANHGIWPALLETVEQFQIEPEWLEATIQAASQDLTPRQFPTWESLSDYCYQVAGVVGLCCIRIWGSRDPASDQLAIVNGEAFQLTNIIRDVLIDAQMGRNYVPLSEWETHQLNWDQLLTGEVPLSDYEPMINALIARNRMLYKQSANLASLLSSPGRMVFEAMRNTYQCQLELIDRQSPRLSFTPPRVSRRQKIWYLFKAYLQQHGNPQRWKIFRPQPASDFS